MAEEIRRACGHVVGFVPSHDGWDEARRQKLRARRCRDCGLAKNREDNRLAAAGVKKKIPKGKEPAQLPVGATVVITRTAGGFAASLTAEGVSVETTSPGAMGILAKVCRKWLAAAGATLTGRVHD